MLAPRRQCVPQIPSTWPASQAQHCAHWSEVIFWLWPVPIAKCICPACKVYLSKLPNIFVKILRLTTVHTGVKLFFCSGQSKLPNIFVQIAKFICPNQKAHFTAQWSEVNSLRNESSVCKRSTRAGCDRGGRSDTLCPGRKKCQGVD